MKKKTGEFAWVLISANQAEEMGGGSSFILWKLQSPFLFCEKLQDIQTGTVTWKPVPLILDGKVEL